MEAVAAHGVLLVILIGDVEHVGLGGHGGVESGVEHHHLGDLLAEDLAAGADALAVGLVVKGGQGDKALNILNDLLVHQHGLVEDRAALHDAVAHGGNLIQAVDNAVLPVDKGVFHLHKGGGVVQHVHVLLQLPAVGGLVGEDAPGHADALAVALAHHLFVVHVDELVLQRRAARVDDENFHGSNLSFPLSPKSLRTRVSRRAPFGMVVISPALLRTGGCFV